MKIYLFIYVCLNEDLFIYICLKDDNFIYILYFWLYYFIDLYPFFKIGENLNKKKKKKKKNLYSF